MKSEHPLQNDNGISSIKKYLPDVLMHLFRWETRWSIPVLYKDVDRWWIHNFTHSYTSSSEWNRRPRMSSGRLKCGSHEGNIWAVRRISKCFPTKSLKLNPHQIGNMGTGITMQKDDSRAFWLYGASQHPQPPRNEPHLSALLCLPPFSMLDEHTLHYAHLQSNKETSVWTSAFTMHVPTLQMAVSIGLHNNRVAILCEECVLWRVFRFHLTAPHR